MEKFNNKITALKFILLIFFGIGGGMVSSKPSFNTDVQIIEMKNFTLKALLPFIKKKYYPVAASIKGNGWIFFLQQFQETSQKKSKDFPQNKNPFFVKWLTLSSKNKSNSIDYYLKKGYVPFGLFEKNRLEIGVAFYRYNIGKTNEKSISRSELRQCRFSNFLFDLHSNYMRTSLVKKIRKISQEGRVILGISALYESMYILDCLKGKRKNKIKKSILPKWFLGYYSDIRKMHRDLKIRKKKNWTISGFHFSEKMNYVLFTK